MAKHTNNTDARVASTTAKVIPFPADRIVRSMEVKSALEIIERCEEYAASDDPETRTIAARLSVMCANALRRRGIPDRMIAAH